MNKYLYTIEWSDYEFFRTFEGESDNDPLMEKQVMEWITLLADGSLSDCLMSEDREEAERCATIKCYLIKSGEIDIGNIMTKTYDYISELEEEAKKKKEIKKEEERRQFEFLKKKFKKSK